MHFTKHTNRCFKKGPECYANLPERVCNAPKLIYDEESYTWSDWCGNKFPTYIFRFEAERKIEDAFMNTHNPDLTSLLGCNTNVMVGMNGSMVHYVTGYQAKSQQKEERVAFERVSAILLKVLRKQVKILEVGSGQMHYTMYWIS